jgi:hypothetical protein
MESKRWACVNYKLGDDKEPMILFDSIRYRRSDSIAWFIEGSGNTWRHWKEKIGWRCIKVVVTIKPLIKS